MVTDTTYDGIAALVKQSNAERTVTNLRRSPPPDQLVGDRMLHILQSESLITPEAAEEHRHPRLYLTDEELHRAQTRLGTVGHPRVGLYPTDRVLTEERVVAPVTTPREAAPLTKAINALLDNPAEQQRLRDAGEAFVQPFTWDSITSQHQAIYEQLLENALVLGMNSG